jgi:hypothetical protein
LSTIKEQYLPKRKTFVETDGPVKKINSIEFQMPYTTELAAEVCTNHMYHVIWPKAGRDLETERDQEGFSETKMPLCLGEEDAKHILVNALR